MWVYIFLLLVSNNQSPVNRVVSLVPGVTETIYALGAQDKLVGVVTPCDYPQGIELPVVGNFSFPNLERIIALSPDIVFVTGGEQRYLWQRLKELGQEIFIVDPQNLQSIYSSIRDIGNILGKSKEADSLLLKMAEELKLLQSASGGLSSSQTRKVLIEISDNPLVTCGLGSFLDELITLAGGINIAHHIKKPYPIVSSEFVIKANPSVIIVVHEGSTPAKRLGWEEVDAVKEGRIYRDIDPNLILRPGPRVIKGIKALKERIYPDELFDR